MDYIQSYNQFRVYTPISKFKARKLEIQSKIKKRKYKSNIKSEYNFTWTDPDNCDYALCTYYN